MKMKWIRDFWQRSTGIAKDVASEPMVRLVGARRWAFFGTIAVVSVAFLGGLGVVMAALLSGVPVTISSRPDFCASCHEIRPAYDQWSISSHKTVNCVDCHTGYGLQSYAKINLEGFQNYVTHLSGNTQLPTQANIAKESCLRCHPQEKLPETLPQASLKISHSSHIAEESCTVCHDRLVHPRLFEAPASSPRLANHTPMDCQVCHPTPSPTYLHGDANVACSSCHSGAIPNHSLAVKRNAPLQETCIQCHTEKRVNPPEACQTCHVSPHGIDPNCGKCHSSTASWATLSFTHPVKLNEKHRQLQCTQCHATTKDFTEKRFLCQACHQPKHTYQGENCLVCHQATAWKPLRGSTPQQAR